MTIRRVVIDNSAPLWAKQLETDLNGALSGIGGEINGIGQTLISRTIVQSPTSFLVLTLPLNYESFELEINNLVPDVATLLTGTVSFDGGVTYKTGSEYLRSGLYANGATPASFADTQTSITLTFTLSASLPTGLMRAVIYPGSAVAGDNVVVNSVGVTRGGTASSNGMISTILANSYGRASHLRLSFPSGNIVGGKLSLYGIGPT